MPAETACPPWATGPREILRHGLELLGRDGDADRRLAMILADNSVELMAKTFLGLPRRVTGLSVPRAELDALSASFPKLLDALEKHAPEKLDGVSLGEIEWYHRLRNELYHDGNGLTVERGKAVAYAELSALLFHNLFGCEAAESRGALSEFLEAWASIQRGLRAAAPDAKTAADEELVGGIPEAASGGALAGSFSSAPAMPVPRAMPEAEMERGISPDMEVEVLREIRNAVVRGDLSRLTPAALERAKILAESRS